MKTSNNLTGVTGEYYVCAELGYRGVLAIPTPKNNPLFDMLATDLSAKKIIAIQVKTMSKGNKQGWRLNKGITIRKNNPNLFVVLVNLLEKENCDYYIYPYDSLSERVEEIYSNYINTPKKDGSARKDVDFRWFNHNDFSEEDKMKKNNWELLPFKFK